MLALYAHVEDKSAQKIQYAFRTKQSSTAEIAAGEQADKEDELLALEQVAVPRPWVAYVGGTEEP